MRLSSLIIVSGLIVRASLIFFILYSKNYEEYIPKDAMLFYIESIAIAKGAGYFEFSIGWRPYVNFFGFFMHYAGSSIIWMCSFSVLAWLFSIILLNKTLLLLEIERNYRLIALILIAFIPSNIAMTYIPLRESLQLLGLTIILFSLVNFFVKKEVKYSVWAGVGLLLAGILHLGLLASIMAGTALSVYYRSALKGRIFPVGQIVITLILFALALFVLSNILESRGQLTETGLLGSVESYQQGSTAGYARATYKTDVRIGSGFQVIQFASVGFIQYMLEPFPWKISTASDIILSLENMLRAVLIFIAIKAAVKGRNVHRASAIYALLFYLIIEFVWSLGTVNWGTAARHHVVAFPFLLVAACCLYPNSRSAKR